MNKLKQRIMVRAFQIRMANGESFAEIAADYPILKGEDLAAIKAALKEASM